VIRITTIQTSEEETSLRVEGWLMGADVDVLASEGDRWLRDGRYLSIDTTGVGRIDRQGVQLLARWKATGARMLAVSATVQAAIG
jgi:ABC-type transporter Mla MlaB component